MPSFYEQLTEASKLEPTMAWPHTKWDSILEELRGWLNDNYRDIRASIDDFDTPGVRALSLSPKGQRNQTVTVLLVHMTDSAAQILDAPPVVFNNEADFKVHLAQWVTRPHLRATVEEFGMLAHQPVVGVLLAGATMKARDRSRDVTVRVPAEQQHRLADASEATQRSQIQLRVEPAKPGLLGVAPFARAFKPRWLLAGGYALRINKSKPVLGNRAIVLDGTPVDPAKID